MAYPTAFTPEQSARHFRQAVEDRNARSIKARWTGLSHPRPHPEATKRSGGLEGALQPAARSLEGFFEAATQHLRMRGTIGIFVGRNRHAAEIRQSNRLKENYPISFLVTRCSVEL